MDGRQPGQALPERLPQRPARAERPTPDRDRRGRLARSTASDPRVPYGDGDDEHPDRRTTPPLIQHDAARSTGRTSPAASCGSRNGSWTTTNGRYTPLRQLQTARSASPRRSRSWPDDQAPGQYHQFSLTIAALATDTHDHRTLRPPGPDGPDPAFVQPDSPPGFMLSNGGTRSWPNIFQLDSRYMRASTGLGPEHLRLPRRLGRQPSPPPPCSATRSTTTDPTRPTATSSTTG